MSGSGSETSRTSTSRGNSRSRFEPDFTTRLPRYTPGGVPVRVRAVTHQPITSPPRTFRGRERGSSPALTRRMVMSRPGSLAWSGPTRSPSRLMSTSFMRVGACRPISPGSNSPRAMRMLSWSMNSEAVGGLRERLSVSMIERLKSRSGPSVFSGDKDRGRPDPIGSIEISSIQTGEPKADWLAMLRLYWRLSPV